MELYPTSERMIDALLHGKLSREQENMEDLLTSMVFGALKHVDPRYLARFLGFARTPAGERPLGGLAVARDGRLELWPWLAAPGCRPCEPDVCVTLSDGAGRPVRVLIEAKYRSPKSSFARTGEDAAHAGGETSPANDQLARQWENLSASGAAGFVVFLTADVAMPRRALEESQEELRRLGRPPGRFCWLSWRHLHLLGEEPLPPLLAEVLEVLRELALLPFHGAAPGPLSPPTWRFTGRAADLALAVPSALPRWSFQALSARRWEWAAPAEPDRWRFTR